MVKIDLYNRAIFVKGQNHILFVKVTFTIRVKTAKYKYFLFIIRYVSLKKSNCVYV